RAVRHPPWPGDRRLGQLPLTRPREAAPEHLPGCPRAARRDARRRCDGRRFARGRRRGCEGRGDPGLPPRPVRPPSRERGPPHGPLRAPGSARPSPARELAVIASLSAAAAALVSTALLALPSCAPTRPAGPFRSPTEIAFESARTGSLDVF